MYIGVVLLSIAAERFALLAVGGSLDPPSKREKPKAKKTLKKRGAYPRQLHALLLECSRKGRGGVSSERQTHRGCSGV